MVTDSIATAAGKTNAVSAQQLSDAYLAWKDPAGVRCKQVHGVVASDELKCLRNSMHLLKRKTLSLYGGEALKAIVNAYSSATVGGVGADVTVRSKRPTGDQGRVDPKKKARK